MRGIKTHEVNALNEALSITVRDVPGYCGASHEYEIRKVMTEETRMTLDVGVLRIQFQKGPVAVYGVNGVSNESLLAIVRDRLECLQRGPFACQTNRMALDFVVAAMAAVSLREQYRVPRHVEGTHKKMT